MVCTSNLHNNVLKKIHSNLAEEKEVNVSDHFNSIASTQQNPVAVDPASDPSGRVTNIFVEDADTATQDTLLPTLPTTLPTLRPCIRPSASIFFLSLVVMALLMLIESEAATFWGLDADTRSDPSEKSVKMMVAGRSQETYQPSPASTWDALYPTIDMLVYAWSMPRAGTPLKSTWASYLFSTNNIEFTTDEVIIFASNSFEIDGITAYM